MNKRQSTIEIPAGLPTQALRNECDAQAMGFDSTSELVSDSALIGQERAIDAITLSARIGHKDFNLYVLGREGMGRHRAVASLLKAAAKHRPTPSDWVYVNNFDAGHKPHAIPQPPGVATRLRTAMQELVNDLAVDIPALFESEDYQTQRRAIEQEFGERHEVPLAEFADQAKAQDVTLLRTPTGFMLAAVVDGKPITPDQYEAMDADTRQQIDRKIETLQEQLAGILRQGPQLEKEHRQRLEELHASMAERVVSLRVGDVARSFDGLPAIAAYLEEVRRDMISNAELFLENRNDHKTGPFPEAIRKYHRERRFDRYAVNVMVSHDGVRAPHAPIVREDLPSLNNLTGRIEYFAEMGTLATNFTLIKPGALHRANGGYLVLDARRVLTEPFAWDTLKRCLQAGEITITSLAERLNITSTISLEPDPIPLNLRVVLIGDRRLHMLLTMLDPEFCELFKLQADFEDALPRSAKTTRQFAQMIGKQALRDDLLPMGADAVAALLDHAVRLADDAKKFTLELGSLADVMREADHYARHDGQKRIARVDIERAVAEADRRAARIKDRMQEAVTRKTLLIDTAGHAVGQVNGLSVIGVGTQRFGRPSRITARARMGTGKLVDIEREVELGGPLHSKGVLILGGYLATTYALDVPMSLHASIVFEQSYSGVEGDSASSAELYALLSALSGLPIRQGLAVTGSVNQMGEVQAIGGVNEKIEGFFDTCKARRLTGQQGVLIPASNVDHLMLRADVVAASRGQEFRVIPIRTIDEGIEILTGRPAGRRGRNGRFPKDSVNALVEARLRAFAQTRRAFADTEHHGDEDRET
ncbi:Lon protease family protein [Sulfitobacter sabulilitoris]|uniref:endopeptidase La n=1 Tax=Sulfitobacter sabulilitoris TaxID=2562655 RepID=A0A5S3PBX7_9RHOB|nr:AAA family ATPase [Sulfitobacter sabulilitoris]TMM51192.1 peptidase [Sulfitobacter sabulilitoris]